MQIKEEKRELFDIPQGYYLAHCISVDFALNTEIAQQFIKIYNMKEKLLKFAGTVNFVEVGTAIVIDNVFNLVVKERAFQTPTYENLRKAFDDMKNNIESLMISKLAIPQINCGLDNLEWDIIKTMIKNTFYDIDIEILVCVL